METAIRSGDQTCRIRLRAFGPWRRMTSHKQAGDAERERRASNKAPQPCLLCRLHARIFRHGRIGL
eukprot:3559062-Pleurochrysis_carterae.AAC.1